MNSLSRPNLHFRFQGTVNIAPIPHLLSNHLTKWQMYCCRNKNNFLFLEEKYISSVLYDKGIYQSKQNYVS